jgi:hypothetical protein
MSAIVAPDTGRRVEFLADSLCLGDGRSSSPARAYKSWLAIEMEGGTADIKVDYDVAVNRPRMRDFRRATKEYDLQFTLIRGYTTRKGVHLRAWLEKSRDMSDVELLRLQAMLGDDPRRQAFNASRVQRGVKGWNVLWTMKIRNGEVVGREVYSEEWTEKFTRWLMGGRHA